MTSDYQMVTTVKREFAQRLPSDLVTLVLEFANEANAEQKRAWFDEFGKFAKIMSRGILTSSPNSIGFLSRKIKEVPDYFKNTYWCLWHQQVLDRLPELDLKLEPDYTSCLHPSPFYLDGRTFVMQNMVEEYKMKLENLQRRIPRPGLGHHRTEFCNSLCNATSGPRRRRGVR